MALSKKDKDAIQEWKLKVKRLREITSINPFETNQEQLDRIEKAKKNYEYFVSYYFPQFATANTPKFHINIANKIKRRVEIALWLQWGRGLSKSVLSDVTIPLWLWINDDIHFFLLIGQNADKASILLDDIKMQFEGNERLIHDFGNQVNPGHWESGFFITKNGFICKSMGMGEEPRGLRVGGLRPDFIACDDWETKETIKNPKRQGEYAKWLSGSIIPTVDGDRCRILLAQNKFHPTMIFDKIVGENKGWIIDRKNAFDQETLKPLWKEKYPDDYYAKRIEIMGTIEANAEYNNDPHIEGTIFTDEMIQWSPIPQLRHFDAIVGMWDVALAGSAKSDFNAIRVWGLKNDRKYLIDCYVKRSKITPAIEWITAFQQSLPSNVKVPFYFEKQFYNDEIKRTIEEVEKRFKMVLNLATVDRMTAKKYDRILTMHPQYQNGRIYYNEKLKNHNDTKEGLAQLKGIEPGYKGHDDAPDADKYAFDYLDNYSRKRNLTFRMGQRQSRQY